VKKVFAPTFYSSLYQMPYFKFFSVVNPSLNQTRNILDCDQSNVLFAHLLHTDRREDLGDNISRDIANFSSNFVAGNQGRSRRNLADIIK